MEHELFDSESLAPPEGVERRLTSEEAVFLKKFAMDALAGRHFLCAVARCIVAFGKVILAFSMIALALGSIFGWKPPHQ